MSDDQPAPDEIPLPPSSDPDAQQLPLVDHEGDADDDVQEASEESFPASDPPSFTRSTTGDD